MATKSRDDVTCITNISWRPRGLHGVVAKHRGRGSDGGRGRRSIANHSHRIAAISRAAKSGAELPRKEGIGTLRLRGVRAELRHRGVLKVAAVFSPAAWSCSKPAATCSTDFEAPHWVVKVVHRAGDLRLSHRLPDGVGGEFKDGGVHPAPPMNPDAPAKPGRADAFLAGLLLLVLGLLAVLVVQQWRTPMAVVKSATTSASAQRGTAAPARTAAVGPPSIAVLRLPT